MSQIRCPSRVDFLNAVIAKRSSSSSFPSPNKLSSSPADQQHFQTKVCATTTTTATTIATSSTTSTSHTSSSPGSSRFRASRVALRTSRLTDEVTETSPASPPHASHTRHHDADRLQSSNVSTSPTSQDGEHIQLSFPHDLPGPVETDEDRHLHGLKNDQTGGNVVNRNTDDEDDDEGVPQFLNELVLDAMDHISECDELKAIVEWMNLVRKEYEFHCSLTDVDLTNGVAMLQVMNSIAVEAFIGEDEEAYIIETRLDKGGIAARANMQRLREALQRFPWKDGPDGAALQPIAFERVDIWGLAGFVLLAGLTGSKADVEVHRILDMEEWMQDRLSDVLASGLEALGASGLSSSSCTQDDNTNNDDDDSTGWFGERKRREELEELVARLKKEVEELTEERDQLVIDLVAERRETEQARAELRWLRGAIGRGRKVLGETNADSQAEEDMKDLFEKVVEGDCERDVVRMGLV